MKQINNLLNGRKSLLALVCGLALMVGALSAQEKNLVIDLGGGVNMEFVLIPAGSFLMGSNTGDTDEKPVHQVAITKPFYMGKYEVTQEQWQALMGNHLSTFPGPKRPVEQVSWSDCQEYLARLQAKTNALKPTLPTEAQWEYACRAGSFSGYYFGDNPADIGRYAWFDKNSTSATHPVGQKLPNAWGLYDMLGNVYEWCADFYGNNYYLSSPAEDPTGPASGEYRAARGGSWSFYAVNCRSAIRFRNVPTHRFNNLGFRVALELK